VSGSRQLGLLAGLPVLVAWGTDDRTIPPRHHQAVVHDLPHAQLREIPGAGHYPHETAPERLLPALGEFLAATQPFRYDESRWRDLLRMSTHVAA
jgi:pimeloyl-ACP methyl ester carboxylesterase